MKTSNKILTGAFLVSLLLIISVLAVVNAKYRKGDYTLINDDIWTPNLATYSLDNVKYISMDNIENVSIEAADSSNMKYEKEKEGEENTLSISKKGDTLFMVGDNKTRNHGRWYKPVRLYFAGLIPVKAINCNLNIQGRNSLPHLSVVLDHSHLHINKDQPFETVKIEGFNRSNINIYSADIKNLAVRLQKSFIREDRLHAGSIRMETDSLSEIQFKTVNLLKTTFTPLP